MHINLHEMKSHKMQTTCYIFPPTLSHSKPTNTLATHGSADGLSLLLSIMSFLTLFYIAIIYQDDHFPDWPFPGHFSIRIIFLGLSACYCSKVPVEAFLHLKVFSSLLLNRAEWYWKLGVNWQVHVFLCTLCKYLPANWH
jgi:hypothetical protein